MKVFSKIGAWIRSIGLAVPVKREWWFAIIIAEILGLLVIGPQVAGSIAARSFVSLAANGRSERKESGAY